jgi:glyoxylase-like metal-dependent hydrolase (beta-lactamase superfamily II)
MKNTKRMKSRHTLWAALYGLAAFNISMGAAAVQAAPLEIQVIQTSESSLYTNLTLIKGEKSAVLVDAPFTRADAHRVVAVILESGKTLETIIVTHDHPDHFFSAEVITDAFPAARMVAAPQVVDDIWKSIPLKLKRWGAMLGTNGPRHPTAPAALDQPYLELEGHRIEIIGPMQGDHVHSTAVWVPGAKALIAGDLLFNEMHLWLGESTRDARLAWARSVDQLAALGATLVVAGHKKPGLPDDVRSLAYTKKYLETFERAVAKSKDSAALAASIRQAFPQTIDVIGDFLLGNSSKVAMGEMPIWRE